jgi:hypothetical protein
MANSPVAKAEEKLPQTRPVSGADFVLFVLLVITGFGVWAWCERGLSYEEPNEESLMFVRGVTKQQAQLKDAESEIAEVQKSLNAARVEQLKQDATTQTLATLYPELANPAPPSALVPETIKSYRDARTQSQITNALATSLEQRLAALKSKADQAASELEKNKLAVKAEFRQAADRYAFQKLARKVGFTLLVVIPLLVVVRLVLWLLAKRKRMSTTEGFRPLLFPVVILIILIAYDAFGFAGAALAGIASLIVLLRHLRWPEKFVKPT